MADSMIAVSVFARMMGYEWLPITPLPKMDILFEVAKKDADPARGVCII